MRYFISRGPFSIEVTKERATEVFNSPEGLRYFVVGTADRTIMIARY